ncbi:hypothetical protein P692DRAFT_20870069 [Suillus brevipes Sb2]|nr:hypothetical protein P692DRAFT_20870069 [Suillus brevipes Sb2]
MPGKICQYSASLLSLADAWLILMQGGNFWGTPYSEARKRIAAIGITDVHLSIASLKVFSMESHQLIRLFHRSPSTAHDISPSSPLDWARNLSKWRVRSDEGTELQGPSPAVVEVPYAKGKRRNASAREVALVQLHSMNATAGSSQSTKPNVTQPSLQTQGNENDSSILGFYKRLKRFLPDGKPYFRPPLSVTTLPSHSTPPVSRPALAFRSLIMDISAIKCERREIAVPSKDPKEKKKEEKLDTKANGVKDEDEELSEEDAQLKSELEMLVERLKVRAINDQGIKYRSLPSCSRNAPDTHKNIHVVHDFRSETKFLRPHYPGLQELFETWPASENKSLFADILSVLAMTYSDTEPRGTLRYRLLSASLLPPTSKISEPGSWGHEYVRHLAVELGEEYTTRQEGEEAVPLPAPEAESDAPKSKPAPVPGTIKDLHNLGLECATFFLGHNAEPDAVDLFVELEIVDRIASLVDANAFGRVCAYMDRCVMLLPPPDDVTFLRTIHKIYLQFSKFPEALGVVIRLNDAALIRQDFNASGNPIMKKQLAFLLARAQIPIEWLKSSASEDADAEDEFPEDILHCLSIAAQWTLLRICIFRIR